MDVWYTGVRNWSQVRVTVGLWYTGVRKLESGKSHCGFVVHRCKKVGVR